MTVFFLFIVNIVLCGLALYYALSKDNAVYALEAKIELLEKDVAFRKKLLAQYQANTLSSYNDKIEDL